MFSIYDGRDKFFQWDIDRKLIIQDKSITEVHFANCLCPNARRVKTYMIDDLLVVDVPNELLTEYMDIRVWGYDSGMTKYEEVFEVLKRTKPDDYIYTEEEKSNYENLLIAVVNINERLMALEEIIYGAMDGKNTFTVDGVIHELPSEMTWGEWIETVNDPPSNCETCGYEFIEPFLIDEDGYVLRQLGCSNCERRIPCVKNENGALITAEKLIIVGHNYTTK